MMLVFFYYTYLFAAWSLYRLETLFSEPVDEFLFKPVIWVLPILLIIVIRERRSITKSLGLEFSNFRKDVLFGGTTAILLYAVVIGVAYIKFGKLFVNPYNLSALGIAIYFFTSLATSITEELTFRGFVLTRLAKALKNRMLANIISTAAFLLIHLPMFTFRNSYTTSEIAKVILLSGIISLVDGYLFYRRRGIVAPIASHTAWNFIAILIR